MTCPRQPRTGPSRFRSLHLLLAGAATISVATGCASAANPGARFPAPVGTSYLLSATIDGSYVEGELVFLEEGELGVAGFGLESCRGIVVDQGTRLSGRLLNRHILPASRIRQTESRLRIECDVVRLLLQRNDDGTVEGSISVLVRHEERRPTGQMEVRNVWTLATPLEITLRSIGSSGQRSGIDLPRAGRFALGGEPSRYWGAARFRGGLFPRTDRAATIRRRRR